MALSQAAGFLVLLLVIQPCLQNQTVSSSFEELVCPQVSHVNAREKREVSLFDFELQVVINTSDPESLRALVSNLRSPPLVNTTFEITSIDITTVCSPTGAAYQCRCEESYAWSSNICVNQNACDDVIGGTCGCLSALPADGQYCQRNTSGADPVDFDIVLDLRFPVASVTPNFIQILRDNLTRLSFPQTITTSLTVIGLNFTTGCSPDSLGGLQCKCEEHFAWSCDRCDIYGACSNATDQTCGCINGLPPDGEFCQPITNVTRCSTTPPTTTTTAKTQEGFTERNLSFTMDLPFDPSYNDKNSSVYKNVFNAIKSQSETHISTFQAVQSINFRSGSTICSFTLEAASFQEPAINSVQAGIFTTLAGIYPIVFESPTHLQFDPDQVLFGRKVTVKCCLPPANLTFSTKWTAEWKRDNVIILEDGQHKFSADGTTLTVLNFFSTDNGFYECTLRGDKSTFIQRSNGGYEHQPSAVITVSPVRRTVPCQREREVLLMCSVNSPYEVEFKDIPTGGTNQITHRLSIDCEEGEKIVLCQVKKHADLDKTITLSLTKQTSFQCEHGDFGVGNEGDLTEVPCNEGDVGEKILVCGKDGVWRVWRDNCILQPLLDLLKQAKLLDKNSLPTFLKILSDTTHNFTEKVVESAANIKAVVEIFDIVANLNISITKTSMRDILLTTGVLTTDGAKTSWDILNTDKITNITAEPVSRRLSDINSTKGDSSTFLLSLEKFTKQLSNESFNIDTPFILLNKTTFTDNFNAEFNTSVEINLLQSDGGKNSLTVITFASMDNVLSVRDVKNSTMNVINGRVVLVQSTGAINNVSFTFDILDEALKNPKCVFWNFSLFEGIGGWGGEGCELVNHLDRTVTCNCNHLTSFSILMSPYAPGGNASSIITYVGVGISICSLVICLIIEAAIWRKIRRNKTSYLRHVTVVNIAVSLLIADVWFIIGVFTSAADKKIPPACTATTFFIHFFYLAMFFWMLTSALLLLHRTVNVFDVGLSNKSMLAIGFTLGYGAPLVIAIITIAATFPKVYVQENGCWLNWYQSKALLAFVVPAFLIIVINLIILLLVIYKILRRRLAGTAEQAAERHILLVISRCLAVLTPLFGLTWGLGVGTLTNPKNNGIHISFAFFNSLQGFFILVFGTLLDKKVQSELAQMAQSHRSGIRSTISELSSGGLGFWPNWRRGVYHVSSGEHSSSDTSRNT